MFFVALSGLLFHFLCAEYNAQNKKTTKTEKERKSSTHFEVPTSTSITSNSMDAVSEVLNNAKVFSLGVSVGTVTLLTQQKKGGASTSSMASSDYSSSNTAVTPNQSMHESAIDIEAVECKRNSQSYLESLSTVPSVETGMQSYIDEVSRSPPLEFDYPNVSQDGKQDPEITKCMSSINEESKEEKSVLLTEEDTARMQGDSYLNSLNEGASSMSSEYQEESYLSSLSRAAPLSFFIHH